MKTKLTAVTLLLALCLVFGILGCTPDSSEIDSTVDSTTIETSTPDSSTQTVYEYALNQSEAVLTVGESVQLSVSVSPEKDLEIEWDSSADEIATVNQNGLVQAITAGSATITATVDGKVLECAVTVNAPEIEYSYWLNLTKITIQEEESKALHVNVDPEKELTVVWDSESNEIATVDNQGNVTGVKAGSTVITATVDGEVLQCEVTVEAKPIVYTYELNVTSASLTIGEELSLNVIATPANDNVKVNWSSDANSVATVDGGLVKAISAGTATIMATVEETTLTCTVEVTSPVKATITLTQPERADLSNNDATLDTLYWEHYSPDGLRHKMFGKDYVTTNVLDVCTSNFWDFGIPLSYNDSVENLAYSNNTNGIHIPHATETVIEFHIAIDEYVKAIRIYSGAWNATNTISVVWNDIVVATGESFTAGDSSTAREVTITLDEIDPSITELTIKVTPTATSGNVSTPGIVILGNAPESNSDVAINFEKIEMPDIVNGTPSNEIFLTEVGTQDWYYLNGKNGERKAGGNMIDVDTLRVEGDSTFDDYKGNFTWTDGTNVAKSSGVNNDGQFGAWASVITKINAETKSVHVWVGGYQSTYYLEVYDSKGNLLVSDLLAEEAGGITRSFELVFAVSTQVEETLMINIYRTGGANCSIAAIALHKDVEYTYAISHKAVEVNVDTIWSALEVTATPDRKFSLEYVSVDKNIATVDGEGKIKGITVGKTTIKVLIDGKETDLSCEVEVTAKPVEYTYSINVESATLIPSQTLQLQVTVNPESESITIVWECAESNIASVDESGLVTAVSNGRATINALVNEEIVASCEITVETYVSINGSSIEDGAGKSVNLSEPLHETYSTLYWEHYQEKGTDAMINANDLILSNTIESNGFNFYDYKATMHWNNGSNIASWNGNTNGRCKDGEIVVEIKLLPNVKVIKIYTGAWNSNVTASIYNTNVQITNAIEYSTGGDGIARFITLDITVYEETEITLKINSTSSVGGNASLVAIALLGTKDTEPKTTVSMSKEALPEFANGEPAVRYSLTELGTIDWFYTNFEGNGTDEKLSGTAINGASLKWDGDSKSWDYKAIFTWNDGTNWDTLNTDKDTDTSIGTNNIVFGAWVTIDFTVDANTKNVTFWVGSWESTYYLMLIDSNGNIIANDLMHEGTSAYKVDYAVNATTEEKLTMVLYRPSGANCSLAAIAIN